MTLVSPLPRKTLIALALWLAAPFSLSAQVFQDVAAFVGIDHYSVGNNPYMFMNGGGAWVDYNSDGWDDIYLPGGSEPDKLYLNQQDGTFTDLSDASGISSMTSGYFTIGASSADFDKNGYPDILVTTDHLAANLLLLNNGDGTFSEVGIAAGLTDEAFSVGATWGDYDQDSWVDLYVVNWRNFSPRDPDGEGYPDRLYRNNGNGTFSDVTNAEGLFSTEGCGLVGSFSDFDMDGDVDIIVGNDYGFESWAEENEIYQNNSGSFIDVSDNWLFGIGMSSMGIAGADYDEDGDLDYYLTDRGDNVLMRNNGSAFSDEAGNAGVESEWNLIGQTGTESWSWGTAFMDYDNDTYVDLFCVNGYITVGVPDENRLFSNLGNGQFSDVSIAAGVADPNVGRGCAVSDYDHDGDLDVIVVNCDTLGGISRTQLLRNDGGNSEHWFELSLVGTNSNLEALGSTVLIYVDNRMLLRQVDGGGASYGSQHSKKVHFGLGSYSSIDSLIVIWPSGEIENFGALLANQILTVVEGSGILVTTGLQSNTPVKTYPNPTSEILHIQTQNSETVCLRVVDVNGKECFTSKVDGSSNGRSVKIPPELSGIYLLELTTESGQRTYQKLVIN